MKNDSMKIDIKDTTKSDPDAPLFDNFPAVPNELLDGLKEIFDIRKMIRYKPTIDYCGGVQDVLDFLENKFKEQNHIEDSGE